VNYLSGTRVTVLVVILMVVLLVAVTGVRYWIRGLDWNSLASENPSTPSSLVPLLSTPTPNNVGDVVFLNDVLLKKGPKSGLFFVEGSQGRQMLVVSGAGKITAGLGNVDVKGRIRRMPDVRTLRKEWHLTPRQVDLFKNEALYITAEYIRAQPKTAASD
jgi:hypothetical protein